MGHRNPMFGKYSLQNLHGEPIQSDYFLTLSLSVGFLVKLQCVKNVQIRSFFWFVFSHIRTRKFRIWTLFTQWLAITVKICSLKFQDLVLQFFFFSWQSLENLWKNMRVISPFRYKVHNWRIQVILYFINLDN